MLLVKGAFGCLWGYVQAFLDGDIDPAVGEETEFEELGSDVVLTFREGSFGVTIAECY